ncbi:MAG TPA: transcriptional regulator [Sphingobacteriaceae bacterium]|nr:transcriptional regulator [Sphingobacteriaceae bacterium]
MTTINQHKPTESELKILQILWKKSECTVRDVHDVLELSKDAGYTTTLKLMQIMHEKGLVSRDTSSKTHIYKAVAAKEQIQQQMLDKMIDTVYNGSAARLVMQALGNHTASKEEIDLIKKYLDQINK